MGVCACGMLWVWLCGLFGSQCVCMVFMYLLNKFVLKNPKRLCFFSLLCRYLCSVDFLGSFFVVVVFRFRLSLFLVF